MKRKQIKFNEKTAELLDGYYFRAAANGTKVILSIDYVTMQAKDSYLFQELKKLFKKQ